MRRPYIVIVSLIVLLSLGWTGYWFWIRSRLVVEIERWTEARRAEGYEITDAGRSIGGFPARLEILVEQPRVSQAPFWTWSTDRLRVFIQPWNLTRIIMDLGFSQTVEWSDTGGPRRLVVTGDRALSSAQFARDGNLLAAALDLTRPILTEAGMGEMRAERAQVHLRANHGESTDRPAGSYGVAVKLENARLPATAATPLGSDIALLSIVSTLPPPLPPIDRRRLADWRDAGGVVDVDRLDLSWGPLEGSANGTLALDREMRPLFSFGTELRGFNQTVDAYANAGLLRPNQASGLKMVLTALAKPDAKGRQTAQLPITGQDGRLYIGPLGVANLPPLFPRD